MKRILAASFGAVLFCVITPIANFIAFDGFPLAGFAGIAVLAGGGAVLGAVLGALSSPGFWIRLRDIHGSMRTAYPERIIGECSTRFRQSHRPIVGLKGDRKV
jgi:hypothetical protein